MIVYKKNKITGECCEFMKDAVIFNAQDWLDISIEEYQSTKIELYRAEKINDCKKFYDDLRYINAKNGHEVVIKCDSNFSDGLRNEIDRMNGASDKVYAYRCKDANGKKIVVNISLSECQRLVPFIANVRSKCYTFCKNNVEMISDLQTKNEIDNYNYKLDISGNEVTKFPDFIIQTFDEKNV